MNIGFERFKRRLRLGATVKSLLFGLSCGGAASAVYIVIRKQMAISPDLWLTLAIGCGTAVLASLAAFFILCPSEKKIAKKLDDDLGLEERVQTMLAFREQESHMLSLQREDTNDQLMKASLRAVRYRHPWRHAIAPILAVTLTVAAIMLPVREPAIPEEPEEPDFEMTDFQETAVLDLIEKVKASGMEDIPKGATVAVLEALLEELRTAELKAGDMKQTVVGAVVSVNRIVSAANTNDECYTAMNGSDIQMMSELGNAMSLLSGIQAKGAVDRGREALKVDEVAEPVRQLVKEAERVLQALEDDVVETDAAYVTVSNFAEALRALETQLPQYTRGWAQDQLDDIFSKLATSMNRALMQQHTNKEAGDMVVTTLMAVFELSEEDIPAEQRPQNKPQQGGDQDDKEDEEIKDAQGGISDGELLFGSDDMIFDHYTNQQVKYGEVLLDYYKTVSDKTLSGTPSPELEQFINDYFKTLFDGSDKENDGN